MKAFAHLFEKLDQNPKREHQVEALAHYFQVADPVDKIWAIALFTDRRPKRIVSPDQLSTWGREATGLPHWLIEDSQQSVGDLTETLALLLPKPTERSTQSLAKWMEQVVSWKGRDEEEHRAEIFEAWKQLETREKYVFNKLITGGFRTSIDQQVLCSALALATNKNKSAIAHRLLRNWHPQKTTFEALFLEEDRIDELAHPYPLLFSKELKEAPTTFGEPSDWLAENKWDGLRAQIIVRDDLLFIWSKDAELITSKFPEFSIFDDLPNGTVLDGEILAFGDERPMPLKQLQSRVGKKSVTKKTMSETPVVFFAFDLLECDGVDVRKKTLEERRAFLEKLITGNPCDQQLRLSVSIPFDSWDALEKIKADSRAKGVEGLMLKKKDSKYLIKNKKGEWWKWMMDPLKVTAVLLYASTREGGRANLFAEFTFAVWADEQLIPFTKTSEGLSDHQIMELSLFVKKNTLERFGPVRSVEPELVFELAFDVINASTRHKCGFTLRGARVLRQLNEAKPRAANSLNDLKAILEQYGQ